LGDPIRKNEKFRQAARTGEERDADRFLMGKRRGKRPLGRGGRRWEDNVKMDLK
jgi:hypothetical protein